MPFDRHAASAVALVGIVVLAYSAGAVGVDTLFHSVTGALWTADESPTTPCPVASAPIAFDLVASSTMFSPTRDGSPRVLLYFATTSDHAAIQAGTKAVEPLVIRANVGSCVRVQLTNLLDAAVSLHPHLVRFLADSDGSWSGENADSTVPPGATRNYTWYAPREQVSFFHTHASHEDQAKGLFGALIVEPPGSVWLDPATGAPVLAGTNAVLHSPAGSAREFVVFFHDMFSPGFLEAINYRAEPLSSRHAGGPMHGMMSSEIHGDPYTPILRAYAGDPIRVRLVGAGPENFHVFHTHAHAWLPRGAQDTDPAVDAQTFGPSEAFTFDLLGGAGGEAGATGDFLYHCHVRSHIDAGMWGIIRVHDEIQGDLLPLSEVDP